MNLFELVILAAIAGIPLAVLAMRGRQVRLSEVKASTQAASGQLPKSVLANLYILFGFISIVVGALLYFGGGDQLIGLILMAGCFGLFATASVIQSLFDIRNILNDRRPPDV